MHSLFIQISKYLRTCYLHKEGYGFGGIPFFIYLICKITHKVISGFDQISESIHIGTRNTQFDSGSDPDDCLDPEILLKDILTLHS